MGPTLLVEILFDSPDGLPIIGFKSFKPWRNYCRKACVSNRDRIISGPNEKVKGRRSAWIDADLGAFLVLTITEVDTGG